MKTSLIAGVVALLPLVGCATGPKLDYTEYAGEPVKSFYLNTFDGWTAVSKDQLVVWSGMNKGYLIKVVGYCPDLMFANTIGVTSTAHTVDKFEKVIVGRDRCLINEIRPLDTKQIRADRKLLRQQQKDEKEARKRAAASQQSS